MNLFHVIALALDPGFILRTRGIRPDGWQERLLLSEDRQILLNCSRQSGKSTTVAALALHTALCRSRSLTLLLSPSLRQSIELFRKVLDCYAVVRELMNVITLNQTSVEFRNQSRIVCLPGKEETIRSFSGVNLLVIDEAARVPDDLYRSVRPMLAVSRGRLICLSTPFGRRGWFHEEWHREGNSKNQEPPETGRTNNQEPNSKSQIGSCNLDLGSSGRGGSWNLKFGSSPSGVDWLRVRIPWQDCPRIAADFIDIERRSMGESWIRQEYECSFEALEGLVFPDFEEQCCPEAGRTNNQEPNSKSQIGSWNLEFGSSRTGRRVGGIDFGFRNPFCALWGVLDHDDVLWISDERYVREAPLHEHVAALKAAERGEKDQEPPEAGRTNNQEPNSKRQLGSWNLEFGCSPTGVGSSITWYADPAGRTEIEELRHAGLKVIRGSNSIAAGIAAVNARLRTGRLRVRREGCPNLLAEAKLYRYAPAVAGVSDPGHSTGHSSEVPVDEHNHALAALRYLVSRLDAGFMARFRRRKAEPRPLGRGSESASGASVPLSRIQPENDELWSGV